MGEERRIGFRLDEELFKKFKKILIERNLTVTDYFVAIIKDEIEKEEALQK